MGLATLSLLEGATITPSGGSAIAFTPMGDPVGGNIDLTCTTDSNLVARRKVNVSIKEPKASASAPNGQTQARVQCFAKIPFLLDNGLYTTITVKNEIGFDSECSAAEVLEFRKLGAQLWIDSDMDGAFNYLSLA